MCCKYADKCPSRSGWCNKPEQDYSVCIPFLITAYEYQKERYEKLRKGTARMVSELIESVQGGAEDD